MRRTKNTRRTRSRRDKGGGGISLPSRSQSNPWEGVGKRVDVSYEVLGHPQQVKPVMRTYVVELYSSKDDGVYDVEVQAGSLADAEDKGREILGKKYPRHGSDIVAYEKKPSKMSQIIRPAKAQIKIGGKVYTEHTGAYTVIEAREKAADIRKRGYNARVIKTGEGYTVYAAKPEIKPGDKVSAQAPSHWFDPNKKHTNTVKKDEKGLYIEVLKGKLYLEDSAYVTLTKKKGG